MNKANFDSLKGKNCVITGGTGVLGNSINEFLAGAGINLAILGLEETEAQLQADGLAKKIRH
jgi:NAD(P)-dependent dehydrogenase (short-subunit alcohol dehydrogenase family)